jgi:hypothetical protein
VRYAHHKYTWEKPFGSVRHTWELVSERGGIHFHATINDKYGSSCGLEIHYRNPPDYLCGHAPSQLNCWLLKCMCWHDGTTLYAEETLWPIFSAMLKKGDHESIFRFLEQEADQRFGYAPEPVEAA